MEVVWYEGVNNYKEHRVYSQNTIHEHVCTLHDSNNYTNNKSYLEIVNDFLENKTNFEVLFSGGLDSELVLRTLILLKCNVKVITLKLIYDDSIINISDLYHSENFCRENNIKQNFLELDIKKFFENGYHLDYLSPYLITEPHVATHFYMIERCDSFPIMAGDYTWPQIHNKVLSPHRLSYSCYHRYMNDHKITGIGNFLGNSFELNAYLIQKHIDIETQNNGNYFHVGKLKSMIYSSLGLGHFKSRVRSSGWEDLSNRIFNKNDYKIELFKRNGFTKSIIYWEECMKKILNTKLSCNDKF